MKQKSESGQALPLGLALVLCCVVTALMVFDTGRAAVDRMRLANAADCRCPWRPAMAGKGAELRRLHEPCDGGPIRCPWRRQ